MAGWVESQASSSTSSCARPRVCRSTSLLYLRLVLFQPVEGRACRWSSVLYLRFVPLQPVVGGQPLTFEDWMSTLEKLEIQFPSLGTLEFLELLQP